MKSRSRQEISKANVPRKRIGHAFFCNLAKISILIEMSFDVTDNAAQKLAKYGSAFDLVIQRVQIFRVLKDGQELALSFNIVLDPTSVLISIAPIRTGIFSVILSTPS